MQKYWKFTKKWIFNFNLDNLDKNIIRDLPGWYALRPKLEAPVKEKEDGLYLLNPYGYECAGPYKEIIMQGKGIFCLSDGTRYAKLVNEFGEPLLENEVSMWEGENGFIPIELDGKFGFIAMDYGAFCPPKFENIRIKSYDQPIEVKLGETWGYVDMDFNFQTWEDCEEKQLWNKVFKVAKEIYLYWQ